MNELDDLLDNLKDSIISLLDKAKDESFKVGIQEGIKKAKEALSNLDKEIDVSDTMEDVISTPIVHVKVEKPAKKPKKIIHKKPESVIKKKVSTESVTKKNIGQPFREEAFNEAIKLFKQEKRVSSAIRKFKMSRNSFYKYMTIAIKQGLISQEEYNSKKDKRGGATYKKKKEIIRKFLLNHEDGSFNADYIADKIGFRRKLITDYIQKFFLKDPKLNLTKQVTGNEVIYFKGDVPQRIEEKETKRERLIEFLKGLPVGEYTYDEISEKVGFTKGLLYQYYEEFEELGFKKEKKDKKTIIVKEDKKKEIIESEEEPFSKPKPLVVSEPKKEESKPDEDEVDMNLKIIADLGEKKSKKIKGKAKKFTDDELRELVKECVEGTTEKDDAIKLFKKLTGYSWNTSKQYFNRFYEKKKKPEAKPSTDWIPCVICGSKIKEPKSDGNVCKNCREEANEFVSKGKKTYNIRCKECGIGKPKKEFTDGWRVCKACKRGK